jgi:hypothetical protein
MTAEGNSGFMFARVVWSDGATQDVGVSPVAGVESLGVEATAPSGGETFWELSVAVGAMRECVASVNVTWQVCGADVTSGMVPLFLGLPNPVGARVEVMESMLTSPTDDATQLPISIPNSSLMRLLVGFDDGSERDLSTDSRVNYTHDFGRRMRGGGCGWHRQQAGHLAGGGVHRGRRGSDGAAWQL